MLATLAILLAGARAAASVPLPGERDLSDYSYEQYRFEFGKFGVLQGGKKQVDRRAIFERNLEAIRRQNADPAKTWFATVNEYTDWTTEEFKAYRTGSRPHPPPPRSRGTPRPARVLESAATLDGLPDQKDWRTQEGIVTPPKDQGACGSCWAFSAVETLESHLAIATGKPAPMLSPQQLVSCTPNPQHCGGTGGCDGATQPLAFNYTAKAGVELEKDLPYEAVTGTCEPGKVRPVAKNDGYVQLPANDYTALMNAVATKGPIAISVAAGSIGWQIYGGGVFSGSCGWDMDHAVQLAGYGASEDGKLYWIVRNSWGPSWGEKGYMRIERHGEGKEPCGMDETPQHGDACEGDTTPKKLCGQCGILSSSSYPTGVHEVSEPVVV